MKNALIWVKNHKLATAIIILCVFFLPLFAVHLCFKSSLNISWLTAEWSAGELIGYIAGFEAFIGTVALGALALWQNEQIHSQHIESLEPTLSMKLIELSHVLYLTIENTGQIEAKDIQISVLKLENNGNSIELSLDDLFSSTFELYPKETVQGMVGISGANIATQIFPQLTVSVSYLRPDLNRRKEYERTVIYNNGQDRNSNENIDIDGCSMASDIDSIARAAVRMANYLDGCQVAKFDQLNILAGKSLKDDMIEAIARKKESSILSRAETIAECSNKQNERE